MNSYRFIETESPQPISTAQPEKNAVIGGNPVFWGFKRLFDIVASLALLPLMVLSAIILLVVNPFKNQGPLLYRQKRMGKDCVPFTAIKFRSMTTVEEIDRGADDPIEHHRITRAGRFLRKSRIDELPQILNVLRGEMSLIGPRPDYISHAEEYCATVPNYRARHSVRPGISGLAQVRLGYIEGTEGTRTKASVDLNYIRDAGFVLDAKLVFETIRCVVMRSGA